MSLKQVLDPENPDSNIWKNSYQEEYDAITNLGIYEEITIDQYKHIQHKCGCPIPTMCQTRNMR